MPKKLVIIFTFYLFYLCLFQPHETTHLSGIKLSCILFGLPLLRCWN